MEYGAERPGINQPVIRKLYQRKRVQLQPQSAEWNSATKSRWRKTCPHIRERGRRWNRFRSSETDERVLVTIKGDAIAAHQPVSKLRLSLAKQFKIEVPNSLDSSHPVVRTLFTGYEPLQVCLSWLPQRCLRGVSHRPCQRLETFPQLFYQLICRLQVTISRSCYIRAELAITKRSQCCPMSYDIDRLRPHPWPQHWRTS